MKPDFENTVDFDDKKNHKILSLVILLLSGVVLLLLIKPLYDPDFYWHLKTGSWIWDNKALPASDPFTIPPQPPSTTNSQFILTSYWLFQVTLYFFYKIYGFNGIILFRFIMASFFVAIFYRYASRFTLVTVAIIGVMTLQLFDAHFPERPQFMSFLCSALLISIIFSQLKDRRWGGGAFTVQICLTMLLWANTHGGFMVGQIILSYILFAEAFKFTHPKLLPLSGKEYSKFAGAICCALLVSLINPNGLNSLKMLLSAGNTDNFVFNSILEFSSLFEYFKITGDRLALVALCTYFLILTLLIKTRKQLNLTWVGLLILLGYMGLRHVRHYPFFLISATLFALELHAGNAIDRMVKFVLTTLLLAVVLLAFVRIPRNIEKISKYGWVPASYFPVTACDIISAKGVPGNIFTTLNWGGYVLWRLAPERKIFLDGRQLDPSRSWEYQLAQDTEGYSAYWRTLFDKYNIQIAILPIFDETLKPAALKNALDMDAGWRFAGSGYNGAVYVRR